MLRALLFDWNGVLLDDEPIHCAAFQRVLGEEGIPLSADDYYRDYAGRPDGDALAAALTGAGRTSDQALRLRLSVRKASYYQDQARRQGVPFFRGALELVRAAAAEGLMLGVVSGALHGEVTSALRTAGVLALFKTLVTAEDTRHGKPDPEGYRRAMHGLNARPPRPERLVHPHEVLASEDTPAGLAAARAAGLLTLGVAHTFPPSALEADLVVERIEAANVPWLVRRCAEAGPA